jgi:hypothetical protein
MAPARLGIGSERLRQQPDHVLEQKPNGVTPSPTIVYVRCSLCHPSSTRENKSSSSPSYVVS